MLDALYRYFFPEQGDATGAAPEGLCANCWGHFAYDGAIRKAMIDKQVDVNNKTARYAFIQDFAVNHVSGIKLKNTAEGTTCARCGTLHG